MKTTTRNTLCITLYNIFSLGGARKWPLAISTTVEFISLKFPRYMQMTRVGTECDPQNEEKPSPEYLAFCMVSE